MNDDNPRIINILLIDDSKNSYFLVKRLFRDFKDRRYQLDWIDCYTEAVSAMSQNTHDVYLVDYMLGKRNGLELLDEAVFENKTTPVIFLTASDDEQIDIKAMKAGAADYLIKGRFDANILERTIRYALEHSQTLEALAKSEKQYRNLIESLPVMFYSAEPEPPYKPLYISPSFNSLGYPLENWKENPNMWVDVLHPEDREWVLEQTISAVLADQPTDYEYRLICKNGDVVWIHDRGASVKSENGKTIYRQGVLLDITPRKNAEEALQEHEKRFTNLFENANDIVYVNDLEGNCISINNAVEKIFGYTRDEMLSLHWSDYVATEHCEAIENIIEERTGDTGQEIYELNCITKDGRKITLEVNSCGIYKDGKLTGMQGISRDITERKQAEEALRESEERFRELFENANDLIYTHDLQGNFTSLNRAGEEITGYTREEAVKLNMSQVIAPEYLEIAQDRIVRKIAGDLLSSYELEIISKDGRRVALELSSRVILKNDKPIGIQGIARDITERKATAEKLHHHALFDPLTNLPNRTQFMSHLETAVQQSVCDNKSGFSVLFLDLDRFKIINDGLGHHIGDKLLIAIAERIQASLRPGDVVARLGGDEFTVLIHDVHEESDAVVVAERIQQKLSAPFLLDNYEVYTSASIGIVIYDETHKIPEDLLRNADAAMYRAKDAGKAKYEIFDDEMYVRNINLLKVETDLRRAIGQKEFRVYYQPIISLETGNIEEFEALVRWKHPRHGLVLPNEFIPISEETGLIVPIGEWVLEEACRQTKEWQDKFSFENAVSVSVNLSAKQLMHPSLVSKVEEVLDKTGLNPQYLKLEVTETMVMKYSDTSLGVLSELNKMGVRLSTDDFGTGHSSLSYLHDYPFERIKIDRSFVSKMSADIKSEAIIRSILMLGNNLEIEVVAEGIETEDQLWQLRSLGCKLGQGFLFSKPVSRRYAEIFLKEGLPIDVNSLETPFSFSNGSQENFIEIGKTPS